jgi:NADH dehydrogenase
VPLGEIFAGKKNIRVHIDTITKLDPKKKELTAKSGMTYAYESCVLALGTVTTYFGIKGLETYAYGIKSVDEITRLKRHLYEDIAEKKVVDKHYIVVGGGPTGVELAAALGSYIDRLCEHYDVAKQEIHVDLIEAAPRILPKMHEKTSRIVAKRLKKLGVSIQTGQAVESANADEIMVGGKPIKSQTVIWTSGVANHPFYKENAEHFNLAPNGRVIIDEHMRAVDNVYVIGDNAATQYTGLAQTALHDALFIAANFERIQKNRPLKKYKPVMPPVVVPVGEHWAVFEWHWLRLHGWPASLLRSAADFLGYSDVLPLGQALGVWRAARVMEDDYFTPSQPKDNSASKS